MKVDCRIGFANLCKQLGVEAIPGALADGGGPAGAGDTISLLGVRVSDDEMTVHCSRCENCEDEPDYTPPQRHYLFDFLTAVLAGDVGTARMLIPSVFDDDASAIVCEQVLRAPVRRAA